LWFCKDAEGNWGWTGFYGAWSEVPADWLSRGKALLTGTDEERSAAWDANMNLGGVLPEYATSIIPMFQALVARHVYDYIPPRVKVVDVFYVVQQTDRIVSLRVGTVPLGTPCDKTQVINGMMVVPRAKVTWAGTVKPFVVVAKCG
jgi:hypothetical protein